MKDSIGGNAKMYDLYGACFLKEKNDKEFKCPDLTNEDWDSLKLDGMSVFSSKMFKGIKGLFLGVYNTCNFTSSSVENVIDRKNR